MYINNKYSLSDRCLTTLSIITGSTAFAYYARRGALALQVTAVALAAISLIAAIDLVRYIFKIRNIPVSPTDFVVQSNQKGKYHWQFKLYGKLVEVKEVSERSSLFNHLDGRFCGFIHRLKVFLSEQAPSPEMLADWLETSPHAREININKIPDYNKCFESLKKGGFILPLVWRGRSNSHILSDCVKRAHKAVDLFLTYSEHRKQVERITILFVNYGDYYPTPNDLGIPIKI